MFKCKIENAKNNILTLTQNQSDFQLYSIEGLNPPKAQINLSKVAGLDGSRFKSSKLEERNLVLYIKINGDIEKNRLFLNSFFETKEWCKFHYENGYRKVYIEGYVESNDYSLFTNNEIMQISIICPNPYFKGAEEIITDISKVLSNFKFPFTINISNPIPFSEVDTSKVTNVYNDSETGTGVIIEIDLLGNVNSLEIRSVSTGDSLKLRYAFMENDKVIINTNKGEKSIKLIRNGLEHNIFTSITKGSVFFQLVVGDNYFSYLADDGESDDSLYVRFKHYDLYRGV